MKTTATLTGYTTEDGRTVIIGVLNGQMNIQWDGMECDISITPKRFLHSTNENEGNRIKYGNTLEIFESMFDPDAWQEKVNLEKAPARSQSGLAAKKRYFELVMKHRFNVPMTEQEEYELGKLKCVFQGDTGEE